MKFTESVYLKYTKEITEDIYNDIIKDLKDQGFESYKHCRGTFL